MRLHLSLQLTRRVGTPESCSAVLFAPDRGVCLKLCARGQEGSERAAAAARGAAAGGQARASAGQRGGTGPLVISSDPG